MAILLARKHPFDAGLTEVGTTAVGEVLVWPPHDVQAERTLVFFAAGRVGKFVAIATRHAYKLRFSTSHRILSCVVCNRGIQGRVQEEVLMRMRKL